jgi:cyclophilin family peptidyl-prolyl cis-trans isomerase
MMQGRTTTMSATTIPPENTLLLELDSGVVTIELLPELAPKHVERIKALATAGFYDGTPFHRVIDGFMAQGGDPTGTGTGGSEHPDLPAEFTPPAKAKFVRGVCGMARTNNPNSANSQFFIMFAPAPSLDGQYTIWGRVAEGMDLVDKIKRGQGPNGLAREPDRVKSMRVGTAAAAPAATEGSGEGIDSTPAADA